MIGPLRRTQSAAVVIGAVALLAVSATAFAQGFYYKEIRKDERIHVFNVAANADRFEKSGETGVGITMLGAGPNGETVVGDNERALQLFFFKHGLSVPVNDPPPPRPPAPAGKISGYVFGDYYAFPQDHDPEFDGEQGFWIRRAYLTYDHTIGPKFAARLRLEVNSNGKMAGGNLVPYVKDAYLRWTYKGAQQVFVGIHPTPTFEVLEGVWGLRYVEKMPADLYKFDSSRDFGITFSGPLNDSATLKYAAQVANDASNGSELDANKVVRFSARYEKNPGLFAEGFYAYSDRPNGADRQTVQGFLAYQHTVGRAGINYLWQERTRAAGSSASPVELSVLSGFGVVNIRPQKVSLFGRLDRVVDPLPDGSIDYLPISTAAPFTFGVFGLELQLHPSVRFAPNVEFVRYGPARGNVVKPEDDLVARATFFWAW